MMHTAPRKKTKPVSTRLLIPEHTELLRVFKTSDSKSVSDYIHDALMEKVRRKE